MGATTTPTSRRHRRRRGRGRGGLALTLPASVELWACLEACWADDASCALAGKFAALALKLVEQFAAWRAARSADTRRRPARGALGGRRGRAAAAARGAARGWCDAADLAGSRDARALCDRLTDARGGAYCARAAAAVASGAARGLAPRAPRRARARARARARRRAAPLDVLAGDAWRGAGGARRALRRDARRVRGITRSIG